MSYCKKKTTNILIVIILLSSLNSLFGQEINIGSRPFEFAMLSDLHVHNKRGAATKYLNAADKDINNNVKVKFVIVNGDISQFGDIESLEIAKRELDSLNVPYFVNVGNHDIQYDSIDLTMNVKNVFGYDRFSFSYGGIKFIGILSSPIKRRDEAYIQEEYMDYLRNEVKNTKNETDVVLVTHYPILEKEMYQTDEIISLIDNLGIDIVLSGHYHMNGFLSYRGVFGVLNRTLLKKDGQNGYNLYMFDDFGLHIKERKIDSFEKNWLWLPLNCFYKKAI